MLIFPENRGPVITNLQRFIFTYNNGKQRIDALVNAGRIPFNLTVDKEGWFRCSVQGSIIIIISYKGVMIFSI